MAGSKLTEEEVIVLNTLVLRPNGAPIRGEAGKAAVLSLSDRALVCDPHAINDCLFTRITAAGRAALAAQQKGEDQ